MSVGGQNIPSAQFTHDDEIGAIGERVAMIGVFAEKGLRRCKTCFTIQISRKASLRSTQRPAQSDASLKDGDDFARDFLERLGTEYTCLENEKAFVSGEELRRAGVADDPQAASLKIAVHEAHGASVPI